MDLPTKREGTNQPIQYLHTHTHKYTLTPAPPPKFYVLIINIWDFPLIHQVHMSLLNVSQFPESNFLRRDNLIFLKPQSLKADPELGRVPRGPDWDASPLLFLVTLSIHSSALIPRSSEQLWSLWGPLAVGKDWATQGGSVVGLELWFLLSTSSKHHWTHLSGVPTWVVLSLHLIPFSLGPASQSV